MIFIYYIPFFFLLISKSYLLEVILLDWLIKLKRSIISLKHVLFQIAYF